MKNTTTYTKFFKEEKAAVDWSKMKYRCQTDKTRLFAVVNGPENNFAVVDLRTAVELGLGYKVVL